MADKAASPASRRAVRQHQQLQLFCAPRASHDAWRREGWRRESHAMGGCHRSLSRKGVRVGKVQKHEETHGGKKKNNTWRSEKGCEGEGRSRIGIVRK